MPCLGAVVNSYLLRLHEGYVPPSVSMSAGSAQRQWQDGIMTALWEIEQDRKNVWELMVASRSQWPDKSTVTRHELHNTSYPILED